MKPNPFIRISLALAGGLLMLHAAAGARAATISATNRYAYAANAGWIDCRADGTNGLGIGEFVCSNFVWSANVGWISLGNGKPTNGAYYSNASSNDWGVNNLGDGRLRGFAYGANIGWINFETNGDPRINLLTGNLSGYAYSANIGWIGLSNAQAYVRTDTVAPGADTEPDGIPDPWEMLYATNLTTFTASSDTDGDGVSDRDEYFADTDPRNPNDNLAFALISVSGASTRDLTWKSRPSRFYRIDSNTNLITGTWTDSGLGLQSPDAGTTTLRTVTAAQTQTFFRVKAVRPFVP